MTEDENLMELNGYWLSRELFETGYPAGAGPCNCTAACCSTGVLVDLLERDRILAHSDIVKKAMDNTQTTDEWEWFEDMEVEDSDYPSGKAIPTAIVGDKCAFLTRRGRCSLQLAAVAAGMDKWALKPLYCVLYPIVVQNKVVIFDDLLQEDQPCCSIGTSYETPLFEACREELTHLLGAEGYGRLESYYRTSHGETGQDMSGQEEL